MASISPDRSAPLSPVGALEQLAARRPARLPQRRFAVGGLVMLVAIVYLIISSFSSAVTGVVTPGQLLGQGRGAYGQQVRLQGRVAGPDHLNSATLAHSFVVKGGGRAVVVTYASDLPGGFRDGAQVEAQGLYDGRQFTATTLTAKCPTKYQAAPASKS